MADENTGDVKSTSGWQRRMAGLPIWGWVAIVAAGGVVVWVWYKHSQSSSGSNASSGTGTSDTSGLSTDQYDALLAQLRNLQAQEANEPTPTPGKQGPPGPPGPGEGEDTKDVEFIASGKESLNDVAQDHHTSAAAIIAATKRHRKLTGAIASYIKKGHFSVHLPHGTHLWIPEDLT